MDHPREILSAVKQYLNDDCPRYSQIFTKALAIVPPVFFRQRYTDFFCHCATTIPGWIPQVVVACAATESRGSQALLQIWSGVDYNQAAEDEILTHAQDEAGHARLFIQLSKLAFSNAYEPGALEALEASIVPIKRSDNQKSQARVAEEMLIDYLAQLNIVEIRTRIHLHLLAPIYYELTPGENKPKVERILQGLGRDETAHVAFTAKLIDSWAETGDLTRLMNIYTCRLQNYNQHTIIHCDNAIYDYGQGRFPRLVNE